MKGKWVKVCLWIPYVLSLMYLAWLSLWIRVNTSLSASDQFMLISMIIFYGASTVGSSDLRRHFWPKKEKVYSDVVVPDSLPLARIRNSLRGRLSAQTDSRQASNDEVTIAWLLMEIDDRGKQIEYLKRQVK